MAKGAREDLHVQWSMLHKAACVLGMTLYKVYRALLAYAADSHGART